MLRCQPLLYFLIGDFQVAQENPFLIHHPKVYKLLYRYHFTMTSKQNKPQKDRYLLSLDEICENTRAIRRVTNRILDLLHEHYDRPNGDNDMPDIPWDALDNAEDMYY